jgi:hypothetical protein
MLPARHGERLRCRLDDGDRHRPEMTEDVVEMGLAAPLASEPAPTLAAEGGFPGDAEQQSFYLWAETHRVGSLNLPALDPGGPLLSEVATRYCNMLFGGPKGSGDAVTRAIRRQTGAPPAEAREFLERSVTAFCPQKARHLL